MNYSEEYNSTVRTIARISFWFIGLGAVASFFVFQTKEAAFIAIGFFFLIGLFAMWSYTCPKCGNLQGTKGSIKDGTQRLVGPWGFTGPNGECTNCGVLLKREKRLDQKRKRQG